MFNIIKIISLMYIFVVTSLAQTKYWDWTNGPKEGDVQSFVINTSGNFYAAFGGTVFRSENNGQSWSYPQSGLFGKTIITLHTNKNSIFCGTSKNGIFRSIDDGVNWSRVGLDTFTVQSIAIDSNGNVIVGTKEAGIFISTNNGETWIDRNVGLPNYSVEAIAIASNGEIFVGTNGQGVYRSSNHGESWMQSGMLDYYISSVVMNTEDEIFLGVYNKKGGVFCSTDYGLTWVESDSGSWFVSKDIDDLEIDANGTIFATNGLRLYRSTNNGSYWIEVSDIHMPRRIYTSKYDNRIFISASGLHYSDDSGRTFQSFPIPSQNIYSLITTKTDKVIANNWYSTDYGDSWQTGGSPPGLILSIFQSSQGDIYASTVYQAIDEYHLWRSSDDGESWQLENYKFQYVPQIYSFAEDSIGNLYLGTSIRGIFRSTDNGENWTRIDSSWITKTCYDIAVAPNGYLFANSIDYGIYRSIDGGFNWTLLNNGLQDSIFNTIIVNNNGDIYVGTQNSGVYRSTDDGNTWHDINVGLYTQAIVSLLRNQHGDLFVGSYNGVFASYDNGEHWTILQSGMPELTPVLKLAVDNHGYIYAGTAGSSVFRSINSRDQVLEQNRQEIDHYYLGQNYPNPFNPATKIDFQLPIESRVTVELYNLLGQTVQMIIDNEKMEAGKHSVIVTGTNLPSGTYFYKIRAENHSETRKMLLLR